MHTKLIGFIPLLFLTLSTGPASATPSGDATRGAAAYQTTCFACHGPTGEGITNLGLPLKNSAFVAGKSDQEMLDFVKKGRMPGDPELKGPIPMPPRGGNAALTDEQILDIIAHIRTLK